MNKVDLILKYERWLSMVYRIWGRNKTRISKGNTFVVGNAFMKRCKITIQGVGNVVEIESGLTRLTNCTVTINGSYSHIVIGSKSNLNHCHLYMEDDNGKILIGKHVTTTGTTNLAVIEGKTIQIGNDCLLSTDISFRVGDSHSIISVETQKRINPSQNITVGNHVWIGHGVKILKGSRISDESIVTTGAIVTGKEFPANVVIAGVPAKVVKENVTWSAQRV